MRIVLSVFVFVMSLNLYAIPRGSEEYMLVKAQQYLKLIYALTPANLFDDHVDVERSLNVLASELGRNTAQGGKVAFLSSYIKLVEALNSFELAEVRYADDEKKLSLLKGVRKRIVEILTSLSARRKLNTSYPEDQQDYIKAEWREPVVFFRRYLLGSPRTGEEARVFAIRTLRFAMTIYGPTLKNLREIARANQSSERIVDAVRDVILAHFEAESAEGIFDDLIDQDDAKTAQTGEQNTTVALASQLVKKINLVMLARFNDKSLPKEQRLYAGYYILSSLVSGSLSLSSSELTSMISSFSSQEAPYDAYDNLLVELLYVSYYFNPLRFIKAVRATGVEMDFVRNLVLASREAQPGFQQRLGDLLEAVLSKKSKPLTGNALSYLCDKAFTL